MDLQLSGKTAFISGSSRGIGYAAAKALAGEGVEVILNEPFSSCVGRVLYVV